MQQRVALICVIGHRNIPTYPNTGHAPLDPFVGVCDFQVASVVVHHVPVRRAMDLDGLYRDATSMCMWCWLTQQLKQRVQNCSNSRLVPPQTCNTHPLGPWGHPCHGHTAIPIWASTEPQGTIFAAIEAFGIIIGATKKFSLPVPDHLDH